MGAIKSALDLALTGLSWRESAATQERRRRARERSDSWRGYLPDDGSFDLDLLPTKGTYRYLEQLQNRVRDQGVTVTAQVQRVTRFPVDRQLSNKVAIMPRDARDVRDFHGKPLMLADRRPGRIPLLLVSGATKHVEELSEWADEIRHYRQDTLPEESFIGIEAAKLVERHDDWVAQVTDAQVGRRRFFYSSTAGLAEGTEWVGGGNGRV